MIKIDGPSGYTEITGPQSIVMSEITQLIVLVCEEQNKSVELFLKEISDAVKFATLIESGMDKEDALEILGYGDKISKE